MRSRRFQSGFSAAEMLIVTAIAAMMIGGAVAAYGTLVRGQRQYTATATVKLPNSASGVNASTIFYSVSGTNITTFMAPNYGSLARAEALREKFLIDTSKAVAVFCLARTSGVYNTLRPLTIPSPTTPLDTPEAFRTHLNANVTGASAIFTLNQRPSTASPGLSAPATNSFTIFVLGYSSVAATIPVSAIYDLDIIPCTNTNNTSIGSYASLRRYVGTTLTGYYDAVYPTVDANNDSFYPTIVTFERTSRLAIAEGSTGIDRFKVAPDKPFYFIFWPDPSVDSLKLPTGNTLTSLNASLGTTEARRAYNHMAGRTAFWFTIPMFPSS